MERIEVTVRFLPGGKLVPLEFKHGPSLVKVLDLGRQWDDPQGRHILVRGGADQTYHLLFQASEPGWYLVGGMAAPAGKV